MSTDGTAPGGTAPSPATGETVGRVAALARYPVKSLQGEAPASATFDEGGMLGDRRYGVLDVATGKVLSAKREGRLLEARATLPGADGDRPAITLPDGTVLAPGDDPDQVDAALSAWLERPVRLVAATEAGPASYEMSFDIDDEDRGVFEVPMAPGRFLDLAPVHLLSTTSLAAGAAAYGAGDWRPARFRPTVLVEGAPGAAPYAEDTWVDRTLAVGAVVVVPFMPTIRCVMTTRAQAVHGLPADKAILRTIAAEHGSNLGVYARVVTPGTVAVGDEVRLLG